MSNGPGCWAARETTHVRRRYRSNSGKNKDDANKRGPHQSPKVNPEAGSAQVPRTGFEFPVQYLADYRDAVGPIQRDGANIEDCSNGDVRAETDQVNKDATDGKDPNSVERCGGDPIDLVPDAGQGKHLVSRVRPDGARTGLDRDDGSEVHDDKSRNGEENPAAPADVVVKDLSNGLSKLGCKDLLWIAHTVGKDDGE